MPDLLYYAGAFLVIALIAFALGAKGFAWFSVGIARLIFWFFIILFVLSLIARLLI